MNFAVGSLLGGAIANKLVRRDTRWLIRIPLATGFFYLPLYEIAIFSPSAAVTLALVFLVNVVGGVSFGPMLAAMQSVIPSTMRATGVALYGFMISLIGVGAGPFLIGVLSDAFASHMSTGRSLQLALSVSMLASVWIVVSFRKALHCFTEFVDGETTVTRGDSMSLLAVSSR